MTPIALALSVLLAASAVSSTEGGSAESPAALAAADPESSESRATDSGPAWEERVIWHRGQEGDAAYFLPRRALDGVPLAELPAGEEDMALLRQAFRLDGQPEWPPVLRDESSPPVADEPPECYQLLRWSCSVGEPRMVAMTLRARIRSQDLTFLARAVAVVPGLLPGSASAVDMVYLEVTEVLRDEKHGLAAGQVFGVVQFGGRITVGGLPLCSHRSRAGETIRPGDRMLVGGKLVASAGAVLDPIFRFHVEDGMLQPSASANLLDEFPMPLEELMSSLAAEPTGTFTPERMAFHAAPPASGDPAYADRIVWSKAAPREALFLPRIVLEGARLEDLPLGHEGLGSLLRHLGFIEPPYDLPALRVRFVRAYWVQAQRKRHEEPIRDCEVPRYDFRQKSRDIEELPAPLVEKVARREITFLGEVIAVVPGWTFAPVEMVYIRVDEILRDRRGQLKAGMVVHTTRRAGGVVIEGQTLCSERDPWEIVTRPGDAVLMSGRLSPDTANEVTERFELLVRDGFIQPRAASPVTDRLPMPLARLLEQFQGDPFPLSERAEE